MDAAGGQILGARRRQEDAFAVERIGGDALLALVTDGLGGLPAGHIASQEATAEFVRVFREQAAS
jgi:serine/threonine protein phosphatase PrpC